MALPGIYKTFADRWGQYQTVWLYSDPHFGDKELAAGLPNRPADQEHIKRINAKVGRKDCLILLGDVGDVECARQLRGYKILVCGNHDAGRTVYENVFDEVYSGALIIGEKLILSHEPIDVSWAMNIHGHVHDTRHKNDEHHFNVCSDIVGYTPINFNQFLKSGALAHIETIHRQTIDKATARKEKRYGK